MSDFSTRYMGMDLPSPLIAASGPLTANLKKIKELADAGAGAVILKSLFEEDILSEINNDTDQMADGLQADAQFFMQQYEMMHKPDAYLDLVDSASKELDIPVIASLNCVSPHSWEDFAVRIEKAGADGIELNIALMPDSAEISGTDVENRMIDIVKTAKKTIGVPISVKLGPHFSSLPSMCDKLTKAGADAFVLFNRFYQPDIDLDTMKLKSSNPVSSPAEFGMVMRWIAILTDLVESDFSATTGIHNYEQVLKAIMAGADTVQMCSALMKNGTSYVKTIHDEMGAWMEKKELKSLVDIRSLLSLEDDPDNKYYQRIQYLKAFKY